MTSQVPNDRWVGSTLAEKYQLSARIGVGGMGVVYRAQQVPLGRSVAVKIIHGHLLNQADLVERFYTEARVASSLNHPNSVAIIDFGVASDGTPYLVMEDIQGPDLATILEEEIFLPVERACHIIQGILEALSEAHALGIIHRDLKPENVIIRRMRSGVDHVKVVDFGLAKLTQQDRSASVSSPGVVCGTPDYMSPEQVQGKDIDGRSDVYAVGIMLFELLTGDLPFGGETAAEIAASHIHDPVPNPSLHAPDLGIPGALSTVVMRALAKVPDERFPNAQAMADALKGFLAKKSPAPPRPAVSVQPGADGSVRRKVSSLNRPLRSDMPRKRSFSMPRVSERPAPGPDVTDMPIAHRGIVAQLVAALARPTTDMHWYHVQGPVGSGRTSVARRFWAWASNQNAKTVWAEPHSTGVHVPYAAVRSILEQLGTSVPQSSPTVAAAEPTNVRAVADDLVAAGLREVASPEGLAGFEGVSRVGAVAAALVDAVRKSKQRLGFTRLVCAIDDIDQCDVLSVRALVEAAGQLSSEGIIVLTTAVSGADIELDPEARICDVVGIGKDELRDFYPELKGALQNQLLEKQALNWMLVEQRALLTREFEAAESVPVTLADTVAYRLLALSRPQQRVLQAVSVLGRTAPVKVVTELASDPTNSQFGRHDQALDELVTSGWLDLESGNVRFPHPLTRDVVYVAIPAEARRQLHARAMFLQSSDRQPVEVRAHHAVQAHEVFAALVLTEQAGNRASRGGAAKDAVFWYQRGLEFARLAFHESADVELEKAVTTFGRRLARSLSVSGDVAMAEGILNEVESTLSRGSLEHASVLAELAQVSLRRARIDKARWQLAQGLEIVETLSDVEVRARLLQISAAIARTTGDMLGATNALRDAAHALSGAKSELAVLVHLELGEQLLDFGDLEDAEVTLAHTVSVALEIGLPAVAARAHAFEGTTRELQGDKQAAFLAYTQAARLAARAGDADGVRRWLRSRRTLSGVSGGDANGVEGP